MNNACGLCYWSDKDKVRGWETIKRCRLVDDRREKSVEMWNLAAKMIDDRVDHDEVVKVQDLAVEFQQLADMDYECQCVVPEQSCRLCVATSALAYYNKEYLK